MRKIPAIFFLLLFLFSAGGFHLLINHLEHCSDRRLASLLNEEVYDETALIEVRMPVKKSGMRSMSALERHYGNVEIDGTIYTYVKKRIEGDVIVFNCIPNIPRQLLKDLRFDLTRANAGLTSNADQQNQKHRILLKYSLDDFDDQLLNRVMQSAGTIRSLQYGYLQNHFSSCISQVPHAPPEC